jgi:cytochrome b
MNNQNPDISSLPPTEPKSRFRNPLRKSDSTTDTQSKVRSIKEKAKNTAAVVGVVAVAGVVAANVAKRRGVKGVHVDLPDMEVTTSND